MNNTVIQVSYHTVLALSQLRVQVLERSLTGRLGFDYNGVHSQQSGSVAPVNPPVLGTSSGS